MFLARPCGVICTPNKRSHLTTAWKLPVVYGVKRKASRVSWKPCTYYNGPRIPSACPRIGLLHRYRLCIKLSTTFSLYCSDESYIRNKLWEFINFLFSQSSSILTQKPEAVNSVFVKVCAYSSLSLVSMSSPQNTAQPFPNYLSWCSFCGLCMKEC